MIKLDQKKGNVTEDGKVILSKSQVTGIEMIVESAQRYLPSNDVIPVTTKDDGWTFKHPSHQAVFIVKTEDFRFKVFSDVIDALNYQDKHPNCDVIPSRVIPKQSSKDKGDSK